MLPDTFLLQLEELVNIDSGTRCPAGLTHMAHHFAKKFEGLGWKTRYFEPQPGILGPSMLTAADLDAPFSLLILCHLDTVFPEGEAGRRPYSTRDGRAYGPGVADMKSGCLFTLHSLKHWLDAGVDLGNVAVFFNGEHEISCPNTRPLIEELSSRSGIVISSEPARPNGDYVRQRKGILRYTVTVQGKSAHAGNNPQDGVCAVTELAQWVLFFKSLGDAARGISVNAGLVSGGTSVNTIPDKAELKVDIRVTEKADGEALDARIRQQSPFDARTTVTVVGGIVRPPMQPTADSEHICALIEGIGREHGVAVTWCFAGGGSDASFAADMGKPALCGLAGVAGKLHTAEEYLELGDLEKRYLVFRDTVRALAERARHGSVGQSKGE